MDNWRYIDTGLYDGPMNMALDEAIAIAVSKDIVPPTLRVYGWDPPAISLGYFQRFTQEISPERCRDCGVDIIRRPTGGRAVLHQHEMTYSVIFKVMNGAQSNILATYKMVSSGILQSLAILGIDAHLSAPDKGVRLLKGACFDSPSWYEISVRGRKLVGSAQVRRQNMVLQHGSILLDLDIDLLFNILKPSEGAWKDEDKDLFLNKVITLKDIMGRVPSRGEVGSALSKGISQVLSVIIEEGMVTSFEFELAQELVRTKYTTCEWLKRR